jgi:hypothetical protein
MSGSTNVPRPQWTDQGFVPPTEQDVLTGVNADLNTAFGGNLNTGTADGGQTNPTPQGQLAAAFTAIIGDKDAQFVYYTNQVDPSYASGRMQDGIARIYFITRNPALATVVTATCTGEVETAIEAGAMAQASDGNLYICQSDGTIGPTGTVDLQFACALPGPITCPAGSLTKIYKMIPGWDSISNAADGVIGRNEETRAEFEAKRAASVAKNSVGMLTSAVGVVLAVPGVLDAYVTENPTSAPVVRGGVTIAANALYVAAVGGTDADVAKAIWTKKSPGCVYAAGNTTVTVLDDNAGYNPPYPAYAVTFTRPSAAAIAFSVTMVNSTAVPSDALARVQAAIFAAFTGADGGLHARIGDTIYASRFYGVIASLGPWARIITLQIGIEPSPVFADQVTLRINQVPTMDPANVTLTLT